MDKYKAERISELKTNYYQDLLRVKKAPSFYSRSAVQSPNSSVFLDQEEAALTLRCPITRTRQTVPIRTLQCKHVETFDLFNLIDSLPSNLLLQTLVSLRPSSLLSFPHSCPICPCKGPLYIDTFISSALALFAQDVCTVNISPSGLLFNPSSLAPSINCSVIDLATPTFSNTLVPPPELDCSPRPFSSGLNCNGFVRRRFSFGDSCLFFGGLDRFSRLSTVDLTSPN